ncbi:MAG: hypothetical protein CMJ46_06865 [Planctomyces sp.]|nr:hypothetical protein [Planctomyces sp.]
MLRFRSLVGNSLAIMAIMILIAVAAGAWNSAISTVRKKVEPYTKRPREDGITHPPQTPVFDLDGKLKHLTGLLESDDHHIARRAAITIGDLRKNASSVLTVLRAKIDHPDENVRAAIDDAIAKIEADINGPHDQTPRD